MTVCKHCGRPIRLILTASGENGWAHIANGTIGTGAGAGTLYYPCTPGGKVMAEFETEIPPPHPMCETCKGTGSVGGKTGFSYDYLWACDECGGLGFVGSRVLSRSERRMMMQRWVAQTGG